MEAAEQIAVVWKQVRGPVIVPLLRASVMVCLAMCVILFVEKVYMAVVIVAMRLIGRRPERQWRWEPLRDDDPELGSAAYPMVLVQIPMRTSACDCSRASKTLYLCFFLYILLAGRR